MNKRDAENEKREIIVENKLWYINVVVDRRSNYAEKNGQIFSLSLKKNVYVKYGSNS